MLGALQAMFETRLDRLLDDFVHGESRCPLDPGCRAGGGACMACLHLGEPSCRWFNRFLRLWRQIGCTIWDLDKALCAPAIGATSLDANAI